MKDAQVAKQVEQRKQTQQNHYGPPQQQDRQYNINVHETIADDRPHEIAPTPTRAVRAAHAITTETAHHSTMTKRNISISTPDFTQHHRNLTTPRST
jgi:hypothetical protein